MLNPLSHLQLYVSELWVEWGKKRAEQEFGLTVSLSKAEPAYYLNVNVNSAAKGHKDTTKMCELQAADWYHNPNGALITSDI